MRLLDVDQISPSRGATVLRLLTIALTYALSSAQAQNPPTFAQQLLGDTNSWQQFMLELPPGTATLAVVLSGDSGDADLYLRYGEQPTTTAFDCRPFMQGSNETCSVDNPMAGTWYVAVHGFTAYADATLRADWSAPKAMETPEVPAAPSSFSQERSANAGEWSYDVIDIPEGTGSLVVELTGGTGDADLYVRFGAAPDESVFDCRPFFTGMEETCTFINPQAGAWHLGVHGFTDYAGTTLNATWIPQAPEPTPPEPEMPTMPEQPVAGTTEPAPPEGEPEPAGGGQPATAGEPQPREPTEPEPSATTWQAALLARHNGFRAQHCAPDLVWNDELAASAQQWADGCVFEHDQNQTSGENLAGGSGVTLDPAAMWYGEIANYNFDTPGFSLTTGHFTQVVWRASTELGCGLAACPGMDEFYVCRYAPAGNVEGAFEQNVLPAGAGCP